VFVDGEDVTVVILRVISNIATRSEGEGGAAAGFGEV
jgi:hypothetical protein